MRKGSWILILLLLAIAGLAAQNDALLILAEGELFSIVNPQGQQKTYEPAVDDLSGLIIEEGSSILTEDNTLLEISMANGTTLIKIAENTTLSLEDLTEEGGGVFQLVYGRMRVKMNRISRDQELWVSGYDTVAGLLGTGSDIGYDLYYDPSMEKDERTATVYCFNGEAEVIQQKEDPRNITGTEKRVEQKDPLNLTEGYMTIAQSGYPNDPLIKVPIRNDIDEYWKLHDFVNQPAETSYVPELEPEPVPEVAVQVPEIEETPVEEESILIIEPVEKEPLEIPSNLSDSMSLRRKNIQKAGAVSVGVGLVLGTAGIVGYMLNPEENRSSLDVLWGMGGLFVVTGSGLSLYSLTMKQAP